MEPVLPQQEKTQKRSPKSTPSKIRILPDLLVKKIAAGEVVERPASVVKELIENALDAGSTEIEIHVKKGGLEEIRVIDNGHGMNPGELKLAIETHATSKIFLEEDLKMISTYGFRGEALAAISRISHFSITSRSPASWSGHTLQTQGGLEVEICETGAALGTDVRILHLFYNVPARRKFLRTITTEFGHVQEVFIRLALLRVGIGFRLLHNDRQMFHISAQSNLLQRIRQLLQCEGELMEVSSWGRGKEVREGQGPEYPRLHGFISPAHGVYGNRDRFITFVNRRPIRDRSLNHAISTAYRELAPTGSYPLVVLHLELSPDEVDVNVHPTKAEVRFAKPGAIHGLVLNTLRKRLAQGISSQRSESENTSDYLNRIRTAMDAYTPKADRFYVEDRPVPSISTERMNEKKSLLPTAPFSQLRVIGQWRGSYILCENPAQENSDLFLIDQHAAHERIGYERLKKSYKEGCISSQILLISEQLELSPFEFGLLEEFIPELKKLGLDMETFGGTTIFIRSIPAILQKANLKNLIRDVLQDLDRHGQSQALEDSLDRILMTLSCHTMVRAHHHLERAEMQALLKQLDKIDFSIKCPHGRPVMISFPLKDIERRFGRS